MQDLIDRLVAQGLEPITVQCAILPLRAIYSCAIDRGDLAANPTSNVNVPKVRRARDRIRVPSLDQARALLAPLELRDRALYGTALDAGLRLGELQALRWENVDRATGAMCSGARRASRSRRRASTSARKAWKAAGVEPIKPHDLRHTCASIMIAPGSTRRRSRRTSVTRASRSRSTCTGT